MDILSSLNVLYQFLQQYISVAEINIFVIANFCVNNFCVKYFSWVEGSFFRINFFYTKKVLCGKNVTLSFIILFSRVNTFDQSSTQWQPQSNAYTKEPSVFVATTFIARYG